MREWGILGLGLGFSLLMIMWGERATLPAWRARRIYLCWGLILTGLLVLSVLKGLEYRTELRTLIRVCQ